MLYSVVGCLLFMLLFLWMPHSDKCCLKTMDIKHCIACVFHLTMYISAHLSSHLMLQAGTHKSENKCLLKQVHKRLCIQIILSFLNQMLDQIYHLEDLPHP